MDEQVEDGNAFAIPALWKPSTLAHLEERATDSITFGFEPLGTSLSLKIRWKGDWMLIRWDSSAR